MKTGTLTAGNTRARKLMRVMIIMLLIVAMMTVSAFAAGDADDAITKGVKTGLGKVWNIIKAIVIPIGTIIFAINALKLMGFWGEQDANKAKKQMIVCAIAVALVILAPLIINTVSGWFDNTTVPDVFS